MNSKYKVINLSRLISLFTLIVVICLAVYLVLYKVIQLPHVSYFNSLDGKQIPIVVETSDSLILSLLQSAKITDLSVLDILYNKPDTASRFRKSEFISKYFDSTILAEEWQLTMHEDHNLLVLYCPYLQLKINARFRLTEEYTKTFTAGASLIDESLVRIDGADDFAIQLSYHPPDLADKHTMRYFAIFIILALSFIGLVYFIQIISFPFIRWKYKKYRPRLYVNHNIFSNKLNEKQLDDWFEIPLSHTKTEMLVITTLNNNSVYFLVPS